MAGGGARRARAPAARRQQHAAAWTRRSPRSTRIPTSRCGCSTRSRAARLRGSATTRPTSRASTGACTTSRSPPTTRRRSSAAATSATSTSAPSSGVRVRRPGRARRRARSCATCRGDFDRYWNSASAYPVAALIRAADRGRRRDAREAAAEAQRSPTAAAQYIERVRSTAVRARAGRRRLALEWAPARMVSDDPAKVLRSARAQRLALLPRLEASIGKPTRELELVSPYFVPAQGRRRRASSRWPSAACKVRVLTNSLAATDVGAGARRLREVPRGAAARRACSLYELKPHGDRAGRSGEGRRAARRREPACQDLRGGPQPRLRRLVQFRSALGAAQHRDGRGHREPRAGDALSAAFDVAIPSRAYEVRLTADGKGSNGSSRRLRGRCAIRRPRASAPRACCSSICWLLPIEWLL